MAQGQYPEKSKLQKTLEKEGWTFLVNESVWVYSMSGVEGEIHAYKMTDDHIKARYVARFEEVRIEKAFDISSDPLPRSRSRAVYVKKPRNFN